MLHKSVDIGLCFVLLGLLLVGCRGGNSPEEITSKFLTAMTQNDWNTLKPLLTEKAQEVMSKANSNSSININNGSNSFTVGASNVNGEQAAVDVVLLDKDKPEKKTNAKVNLRLENGEWRVFALKMEVDKGMEFSLDFEHPEASMGELLGKVVGEGLKELGKGMGEAAKGFSEGLKKATEDTSKPKTTP